MKRIYCTFVLILNNMKLEEDELERILVTIPLLVNHVSAVRNIAAYANFYQKNLHGVRRVKGFRLRNGNFIFALKSGCLWKLVLTSNNGRFIKNGYVRDGYGVWTNPASWRKQALEVYTVFNFHGIRGGNAIDLLKKIYTSHFISIT